MPEKELKHFILISFTVKHLPQKKKVKVLRVLNGYRERKKGKRYDHKGLLEEIGGEKVGANVVLVPYANSFELQNFFSKYGIKTKAKEVWAE